METHSENRRPSRTGGVVMIVVASLLLLGGAGSLITGSVTGPPGGPGLVVAVIAGRVVVLGALAWLLVAGVRRIRRAGRSADPVRPADG